GVMLYEMLTGERPFKGENDMAVLNALTSAKPAPAPALDPELPAELGRVVLKCLQKDRDRRYDSVDQLLQDLRSFLAVGSQVLSSVYDPAAMARPRPRRWQAAAGAGGAVVVLLALALAVPASRAILLRPFSGAQAAPQRLVAVLPFINSLGPGPENQALADGLTFSLTGMVARLGTVQDSLWIVPASEIVRQSVTTAGDALKYFGVDTVLTGSVQQTGKTMEIVLYLIDPTRQPPRTLDSRTVAAPLSPSLTQRMVDELAQLLGVESDVRSRLSADAEGGTSAEVYTLYLQGLGFLQRYDQAGNLDKAISVFESALEGDAYYGPAHAGLCEALWQKFNQTDDVSLTTQAVASCESAAELAAGQASVLATVARSYLEMGDNRRAEAELKRALELEPANADAYRWLGWAAFLDGRSAESEAAFRKAIELNPRLWLNHNDLGETLYQSGRFEEALSAFEESRRLTPENYLAYNALAVAHDELNHVDVALEHFRRSIELQPNPMAYRNLGYIRFREQRYDEAVDALEKARDLLAESPSFNDWPLWGSLASAYYWAGDQAAAEQTWERVIAVATPLYEVNPEDADVLVWLSDAHIALGDLERARFFQDRLLALALEANYVQYQIGRNYERLGDRKLAFSYIRRALEQRFDPRVVDRDPWLENLRAAPEYQVLRQQYMPATG
ncbi:MAG: tetratricopeptide repeat protein, partial [Acidobacteriota bacterium]|nr:tetratricopeptide repeat protein [Acidobacteriota bacterium]